VADFSDASAVGCGAHDAWFNLLRPSEKRNISAWQIAWPEELGVMHKHLRVERVHFSTHLETPGLVLN
jgi:hypothetical protein